MPEPPVRAVIEMAQGLEHIHSQGLVHRDIKPENILVLKGVIKLADFGLSKPTSAQGTYTASGAKGTLKWMAPEVIEMRDLYSSSSIASNSKDSKKSKGDKSSDIFSLGCVIFYFLTKVLRTNSGKAVHPFGFNRLSIEINITKGEPANYESSLFKSNNAI